MLGQHQTPLYTRVQQVADAEHIRLHVPGHKGRGPFFSDLNALDFTEIPGLDDLHDPQDVVAEAQCLAAECHGSSQAFFLVNGSTAGNLAMILSVCKPGDTVIVQRNAHRSVLNGLMLAHGKAAFVTPRWDPKSSLHVGVDLESIQRAVARYPDAKAVFLTDPDYFGLSQPLRPIADWLHQRGIPLLVDQAHGAHFGFHPAFPESAIQAGADAVVQSSHKSLSALTMGAMLHIQGALLDPKIVQRKLAMIQTSSPSYLVMASLDMARCRLATQGYEALGGAADRLDRLCAEIRSMETYLAPGMFALPQSMSQDPFKLWLGDRSGSLNGGQLLSLLAEEGCVLEMANERLALACFGIDSTDQDADGLLRALERIATRLNLPRIALPDERPMINPQASGGDQVSTETVDFAKPPATDIQRCPLSESVGCISAEMIVPYPPGIPILYAGERISEGIVERIERLREASVRFQGAVDPQLNDILVDAETIG